MSNNIMSHQKPVTQKVRIELILLVLLFILNLYIYIPVQDYRFIQYDDYEYIVENPNVNTGLTINNIKWAFLNFHAANWHPVTWISHMIDCSIYGNNAGMHHVVNVFFHIFNTFLIFYFLLKSTGLIWPSFFTAAFFAVHPMHIESVAWIAERKDVLSTFFMMLSLLSYFFYTKSKKWRTYLASLLLFAIGLMSKPMVISLPLLFLLFDFWPLERLVPAKKVKIYILSNFNIIAEKIPFFILSIISGWITIIAQGRGEAIVSLQEYSVIQRIAFTFINYFEYIIKCFYPVRLSVFYPAHQNMDLFILVLSFSLMIIITFFSLKYSDRLRFLIFGWLWFIITLVPVIGIVKAGHQSIADRYSYIPYTGLFIIITFGINEYFTDKRYGRLIKNLVMGLCVACLSLLSVNHIKIWANGIFLFQNAVKKTEDNFLAHHLLGIEFANINHNEEAITHFNEALKINSAFVFAYLRMGILYTKNSQYDKAESIYKSALKIQPDFFEVYYNLAGIYLKSGRTAEAVECYENVIKLNPFFAPGYKALGIIYANSNKSDRALLYLKKAGELNHDYYSIYENYRQIINR